ncbi:hypothetical protein AVEN_39976-1 [Araneus ventricosus]|uniref:Uncharacterized protein n=1 Tax=Araneus ventricosus TaxID=182803 RepID=A0A4Y2VJU2_ARAVE|nr:hypothetical protein AVEN_39976-1 [Araneus ventricosus]
MFFVVEIYRTLHSRQKLPKSNYHVKSCHQLRRAIVVTCHYSLTYAGSWTPFWWFIGSQRNVACRTQFWNRKSMISVANSSSSSWAVEDCGKEREDVSFKGGDPLRKDLKHQGIFWGHLPSWSFGTTVSFRVT